MSISPPATASTAVRHHTYWCHECDMSVLIQSRASSSTSSYPPLCPNCRHDFLEQMDSFAPLPPNSFPNPNTPFFHLQLDPTATATTPISSSDDNFLLDSPYLRRLIQHLMINSTSSPTPHPRPTNPPHCNSPASTSAIESLDRVTVDPGFLQKDPARVCPVCKDQFPLDSEAKIMPCKHIYHSECITPWLQINSSCPVCRYRLQNHDEIEIEEEEEGREDFIRLPQLDELLDDDDDEDWVEFRNTLRNAMRRHQFNGQAEDGDGGMGNYVVGRDVSVEMDSSSHVEASGNVGIDGGINSSRSCDEVDTMKS